MPMLVHDFSNFLKRTILCGKGLAGAELSAIRQPTNLDVQIKEMMEREKRKRSFDQMKDMATVIE